MATGNSDDIADDQSLSIDVIPVFPRRPLDQNRQDENANQQADIDVRQQQMPTSEVIPDPPTDWQFNVFLNQLSESLTSEDLSTMKSLFEGEGGIGRGTLEKIETPLELFRILRTRGYISRDNLLYLQAVLFWSGRKDLVNIAVDYSNTIGNVLHFYAPSCLPENGYRYVRFHVDGKNFQNYSRQDLHLLRSRIMKLLCVPEQFVIIRGIEPTSSLVITLMIPDMYVSILQELLEDGEEILDIGDLGVDIVEIDGDKIYNMKGATAVEVTETEQQVKLVNVYAQLQQTSKRLEDSEDACIDLYRKIDALQSKLSVAEHQLNSLMKVVSLSSDGSQPATLKELSSLKEFTESVQQVDMDTINRKAVQRMLSATAGMVSTRTQESHRIQKQQLMLEFQYMKSRLDMHRLFEFEGYRFPTDISNIDTSVLDVLRKLLHSLKVPIAQVLITLTPARLKMLKKISSRLRHEEKEKLKQKYEWSAEGTIEKYMEKDSTVFLAGLLYKEIEKTRVNVDVEIFIAKCLTDVDRDVLKVFLETKPNTNLPSPRYAEAKQTKEPQSQQQQEQGIHQL